MCPRPLSLVVLLSLFGPLTLDSRGSEPDGWYAFHPTNDPGPSVIGMADWNDAPAGARGRIAPRRRPPALRRRTDPASGASTSPTAPPRRSRPWPITGRPSMRSTASTPSASTSSPTAPAGPASSRQRAAVEFDPAALDRHGLPGVPKLKEAGIYVTLSAHFGTLRLGPADRRCRPVPRRVRLLRRRQRNRVSTPHSAIHYSPELQDVQIRQMVTLLTTRTRTPG